MATAKVARELAVLDLAGSEDLQLPSEEGSLGEIDGETEERLPAGSTTSQEDALEMTSVTLYDVTDTLKPEHAKYGGALHAAVEAFKEAERLFADPAFTARKGWRKDEENDDGDVVYAKNTPKGKMVTISTSLPMDVDSVMNETWVGADTLPKWNKNIDFASTIASLTDHVDVLNYGNNDVLIVSGREFFSARIYRKTDDDTYLMASRSVDLPEFKPRRGKVRAWLHLAAARFRSDPEDRDRTLVDVVMLADLKGFLPKMVVNQVIGKIMLMDTEENKKHFADLKEKKTQLPN